MTYRNTAHALVTIARQARAAGHVSPLHGAADSASASQERLRGLFSGLGPTLLRDAPYSGLYLLMFSNLRDAMGSDGQAASPATSFAAGALAGGLATFMTHPPDVMRTRLQLRRNMALNAGAALVCSARAARCTRA